MVIFQYIRRPPYWI